MENKEEEGHKDLPNQEVESQAQCERLNNEERDTLLQSVLTSGRLDLHQDSTDTSGTRRMEDYPGELRSIIFTGNH